MLSSPRKELFSLSFGSAASSMVFTRLASSLKINSPSEEFAALGLTPATYAIFAIIRDNPGVPPSSLASVLRLRLPNLIKILNELESSGFIKRNRSKADRRAVELMLTPKGAKLIQDGARLTEPYNRKMLAPLSESEQRMLLELLNRMLPF